MTVWVLCCTVLRGPGEGKCSPQLSQVCQLFSIMNYQFKLKMLFGPLKLSVCLSIFIGYDLGDQHPRILHLIRRHESHNLSAEDASRFTAGPLPS